MIEDGRGDFNCLSDDLARLGMLNHVLIRDKPIGPPDMIAYMSAKP